MLDKSTIMISTTISKDGQRLDRLLMLSQREFKYSGKASSVGTIFNTCYESIRMVTV